MKPWHPPAGSMGKPRAERDMRPAPGPPGADSRARKKAEAGGLPTLLPGSPHPGLSCEVPQNKPRQPLSPPQSSRSTQNDHPTCGELAVGPAIMPRTIRPHFGLTFSPTLLMSRGGSDGWSLSIFSHAGATGRLSAGTVCTGLLLCGGLLGDTKLPSASPSRLSCLQKRDSSIKTHIPGRIANNNSKFHIHRELRASPWQPCGDF